MMDHMTEVSGLSWPRRILNTLQNDDRLLAGGAAFLGGLMTAMGRITGEVAPFGVAYAAAAPRRMTVPALLGAALGYLLMAAPPAAWQYPLAALLAVGLRQLLAVITHKARPWQNVIGVLIGLTAAVILPGAYRHPLVYDVLLWMTSLLMAGAAAVFLQRGLALLEPDRKTPRERTLTASLAVAAALCLMGLCSISAAGVSLGRVAASVLLLIAAAGAGSRAGTLIGVICGLVVGFSTGEFTLSITCFSVGGLLCGLFAPLGRLGSVLALAISYGFFAMLASRSVTGFLEVLLAAGIFWLLPAAVPRRAGQLIAPGREQKIAPLILSDRLEAAATALREVSSTTREVADHLQKSTVENPEMLFDRLANRYCKGCLYQMICWQQHYGDTVEALGRGLSAYRKENHIPAETLAGLNDRCPSRERLAAALEKEYAGYLSREEQRVRTARVRSIVTDQFDGLAGTLTGLSEYLRDHPMWGGPDAAHYGSPAGGGARVAGGVVLDNNRRSLDGAVSIPGSAAAAGGCRKTAEDYHDGSRAGNGRACPQPAEWCPAADLPGKALLHTGSMAGSAPRRGKRYLRRYTAAGKGRRGYTGAHSFRWDGHRRACCAG